MPKLKCQPPLQSHPTLPHYYPPVPLISPPNADRPLQSPHIYPTSIQHISPGNAPRPLIEPLKPAVGAQF
ncbi:hypothetical protein [Absidia glauca]|uniref:Uncharacterized protein n=1 Tax=Absidia glauca TaxID=4829 RepID=A0A168KTT1_ABSGL|nr:hypothetical protein [Absidia glauca]